MHGGCPGSKRTRRLPRRARAHAPARPRPRRKPGAAAAVRPTNYQTRFDLYITTSWSDLDAATRAAQPLIKMLDFAPADVTRPADVRQLIAADHPDTLVYLRAAPGPAPLGPGGAGGRPAAHHGRGGDRKTLRDRPGLGAAPQPDPAHPAAPAGDLPGRSLPVQRTRPPRHHPPVPEPGLRAHLERGTHRPRGHQLARKPYPRRPGHLLRQGRRTQGHGAEPSHGSHGPGPHGTTRPPRRRLLPRDPRRSPARGGHAPGGDDAHPDDPRPLYRRHYREPAGPLLRR